MSDPAVWPSFTIVIPTYQRRALACEAVGALARLDYAGAFDVIVVVDGSTDGTARALAGLKVPFALRVVEQANAGQSAARNAGAALATGEIVLFLDDDMICAPDLLAEHARSHAAGADAVVGEIPLEANSPKGFLTEGIAAWAESSAQEAREGVAPGPFQIFSGQISVRRTVFDALGGFDCRYCDGKGAYGKEDADFGVRLLARYTVGHNPRAISHHRYVVSPREYLRRGHALGLADAQFARAWPQLANELFARNHIDRASTRRVIRPLARVPGLHRIMAVLAAMAAWVVLRTPWRSSRGFLRVFHAVRMVSYWAGVDAGGGVPDATSARILCYHAIADHADDPVLRPYSVPRARFERQIAWMQRAGYAFVTADDLEACLAGVIRLPRKAVLLTFDDCYDDLLDVARRVLAPRRIPALAFAVTGLASHSNEWDQRVGARPRRLLTWAQLRELPALGVTVGSHSRTHPRLTTVPDSQIDGEVAGPAADIVRNGLPLPRHFCFPYGDCDARVRAATARAGYALGFGVAPAVANRASARMELPRIELRRGDTGVRFWLKLTFPRLAFQLRWRLWGARLRGAVGRRIRPIVWPALPQEGGRAAI
ncbi:MAG: hypothetical protein RIS94_573 [Pseudomonadota bacterium]|jgi:peptidoglycan/xylan/chitin deacetylase (PgdA/CDA1 family)/glycosyltransferase involved in cell wall biosynthesis